MAGNFEVCSACCHPAGRQTNTEREGERDRDRKHERLRVVDTARDSDAHSMLCDSDDCATLPDPLHTNLLPAHATTSETRHNKTHNVITMDALLSYEINTIQSSVMDETGHSIISDRLGLGPQTPQYEKRDHTFFKQD